ncbi:MAG TPA: hypothetical protein VMP13_06720 [Acidimicrobiia bacterium]|nr:hypothetical protein [Acidimicrobiia bacterium]
MSDLISPISTKALGTGVPSSLATRPETLTRGWVVVVVGDVVVGEVVVREVVVVLVEDVEGIVSVILTPPPPGSPVHAATRAIDNRRLRRGTTKAMVRVSRDVTP